MGGGVGVMNLRKYLGNILVIVLLDDQMLLGSTPFQKLKY